MQTYFQSIKSKKNFELEFHQINQIVKFDNDQSVAVNIHNNWNFLQFLIVFDMKHKQGVFEFHLIQELSQELTKYSNVYTKSTNLNRQYSNQENSNLRISFTGKLITKIIKILFILCTHIHCKNCMSTKFIHNIS